MSANELIIGYSICLFILSAICYWQKRKTRSLLWPYLKKAQNQNPRKWQISFTIGDFFEEYHTKIDNLELRIRKREGINKEGKIHYSYELFIIVQGIHIGALTDRKVKKIYDKIVQPFEQFEQAISRFA